MVLYGAPVWEKAINIRKYNGQLQRLQRGMLIRVASAFRTVSGVALQVITGTIPIDLMVIERGYVHKHKDEVDQKSLKKRARAASIDAWQSRWESEYDKAQWTKRLIPNIEAWMKCSHRSLDYYLTQALTAHGVFRFYAKRFHRDDTDACIYCGNVDTVEHTIFECSRWEGYRETACKALGYALTPDTLVPKMIETKANWKHIHRMIADIMSRKEKEERERQSNS